MRACAIAILSGALSLSAAMPASAQQTIRIGELNSYEKHPAFLQPYKKGWQMAIDEINGAGGVLGKNSKSFRATTAPTRGTRFASPRSWRSDKA